MPEIQEALKEKTPMVDLDTTGNAVDVEINDSKADIKEVETKKGEPIIEVKEEKDEREEYSEGVKKRIDRLTYKIREAERREKEAERKKIGFCLHVTLVLASILMGEKYAY